MSSDIQKTVDGSLTTIKVLNKGSSDIKEKKLYEIDSSKDEVKVFRTKVGSSEEFYVTFEGFKEVPDIFSEKSNYDDGTLDSLYSHSIKYNFKKLIISKVADNRPLRY